MNQDCAKCQNAVIENPNAALGGAWRLGVPDANAPSQIVYHWAREKGEGGIGLCGADLVPIR